MVTPAPWASGPRHRQPPPVQPSWLFPCPVIQTSCGSPGAVENTNDPAGAMMGGMASTPPAADDLVALRQAAAGDPDGWRVVLDRHRGRLRRLAAFRLDRRLWGRVDPSDVVQEALADAARRVAEFLADP